MTYLDAHLVNPPDVYARACTIDCPQCDEEIEEPVAGECCPECGHVLSEDEIRDRSEAASIRPEWG